MFEPRNVNGGENECRALKTCVGKFNFLPMNKYKILIFKGI